MANRQPIFTGTPILFTPSAFDPPIPTPLYDTPGGTQIFEDQSQYGSLITRITVTATADSGSIVTEKVIYLLISPDGSKADLYTSALMPGTPSAVIPPSVVFTFGNGLIMKPNSALFLAASTNYGITGQYGDYVVVTVEGGTYDPIP